MLAVTTGGREAQFSGRGINGPIDDLLYPLNHGLFHYTGMQPLPPFVAFRTVRTTPEEFEQIQARYIQRLLRAPHDAPIAYRWENGGDYDDTGVLHVGIDEGRTGSDVHVGARTQGDMP